MSVCDSRSGSRDVNTETATSGKWASNVFALKRLQLKLPVMKGNDMHFRFIQKTIHMCSTTITYFFL